MQQIFALDIFSIQFDIHDLKEKMFWEKNCEFPDNLIEMINYKLTSMSVGLPVHHEGDILDL